MRIIFSRQLVCSMLLFQSQSRMVRLIPVFLLCSVCYFVYIQALECGIVEQMEEENLQNVLHKCMGKRVAGGDTEEKPDSNKNSSESSEETEQGAYNARRGMTVKIKRSLLNPEKDEEIKKRDTAEHVQNEDDNNNHSGNETDTHKCVLQCIFTDLGMVDTNGYPEHQRVAQGLLKNARGQELRDFIQDSTDECFQLMDQGEKLDSCEYATHLVTCLAEKGRSNCADWQIMTIPFHT